jgi:AcrR family transcriptional regulator
MTPEGGATRMTTTSDPATPALCKPAGNYHHGNLREALIAAAIQILVEEGINALSLREVARRAGVSQSAPYRHFADKEAVLAAVAAAGFRALACAMRQAAAGAESPARRVMALGQGYVSFGTQHPCLLRLMFSAEIANKSAYPELQAAGQTAYGLIRDAIVAHLAQAKATPIDPEVATVTAWALVHGLATLLIDRQIDGEISATPNEEALIAAVTAILINGLD